MNKFYKKGWLIFFFTCFGGCIVAIMISYFQLSLLPVANKTVNPPEIERGSIVDRSGFPLAVQTTFYRIGINTKDIKDKELFSTALAPVLDMSYEELFEKIDKLGGIIALFTNRNAHDIQDLLNKNPEIKKHVQYFVGSDMVTNMKPHPEGIFKCMEKFSVKKEDTIYVGDSPCDFESSRDAGCDFYYVDRFNKKTIPVKIHETLEDLVE